MGAHPQHLPISGPEMTIANGHDHDDDEIEHDDDRTGVATMLLSTVDAENDGWDCVKPCGRAQPERRSHAAAVSRTGRTLEP